MKAIPAIWGVLQPFATLDLIWRRFLAVTPVSPSRNEEGPVLRPNPRPAANQADLEAEMQLW